MSVSNISYDGFGKTMSFQDMEEVVEMAIERPTTVFQRNDTKGIRSLDKVHSFGIQNIFSLPFQFINNVRKLGHAYWSGNEIEKAEAWIRVTTLPFGFGGILTEWVRTAITINLITDVALIVLTPIHAVFAGIYFVGQLFYETLRGAEADTFVQITKQAPLDALHEFHTKSDLEQRKIFKDLLFKDREGLQYRIGENGVKLLSILLDEKFSYVRRDDGFPELQSRYGVDIANLIFKVTDPKKETIEEEDLIRIIEASYITSTLQMLYRKGMTLTSKQKNCARQFFRKNVEVLPPEKAMHHTFASIHTTVKKNFKNFSRIVRPWMALEFSKGCHPSIELLKAKNLGKKQLGIDQGRALLKGVYDQAQKTELVHSLAMLGIFLVGGAAMLITSCTPLALIILGFVLEMAYFTIRNSLAYGYLDAKGETFEYTHCIPTLIKDLYFWGTGKPFDKEVSPNELLRKPSSYSPQEVMDASGHVKKALKLKDIFIKALFA